MCNLKTNHILKIMIYNSLFNLTPYTNYKLGIILKVSTTQVIQYRKSKTINYERLIQFMVKLNINKLEYEQLKIEL
jgi:hypothetical protein